MATSHEQQTLVWVWHVSIVSGVVFLTMFVANVAAPLELKPRVSLFLAIMCLTLSNHY